MGEFLGEEFKDEMQDSRVLYIRQRITDGMSFVQAAGRGGDATANKRHLRAGKAHHAAATLLKMSTSLPAAPRATFEADLAQLQREIKRLRKSLTA